MYDVIKILIVGLSTTAGRFLGGVVGNLPRVNPLHLVIFVQVIASCVLFLVPFLRNSFAIAFSLGVIGLLLGRPPLKMYIQQPAFPSVNNHVVGIFRSDDSPHNCISRQLLGTQQTDKRFWTGLAFKRNRLLVWSPCCRLAPNSKKNKRKIVETFTKTFSQGTHTL